MQNKMWSITLDNKLHLAPIGSNPQNVLDIATGTGIWAIDFGTFFPSLGQGRSKTDMLII